MVYSTSCWEEALCIYYIGKGGSYGFVWAGRPTFNFDSMKRYISYYVRLVMAIIIITGEDYADVILSK